MIKEKHVCTFPEYPREVQLSAKRRPVYWKGSAANIPKKYKNYLTDSQGFLIDPAGNRVVSNPLAAGTPRVIPINAQTIYVGLHPGVRSKIVNDLHTLFHDAFLKQLPAKISLNPDDRILICLHFHDIYHHKLPDLDNLSHLFLKCGVDCLTETSHPNQTKKGVTHKLGIIPDDKACFIPHIVIDFTPVEDEKDRRLDFILYVVNKAFSVERLLDINSNAPV